MNGRRGTTPPTQDECLGVLREAYKLLTKTGPGARKRKDKALELLRDANDYLVETYNMTNPKAGILLIHNLDRGSCCDPATETYWSM